MGPNIKAIKKYAKKTVHSSEKVLYTFTTRSTPFILAVWWQLYVFVPVPPEVPSILVQEDSMGFWNDQRDELDEDAFRLEYDDIGDIKEINRRIGMVIAL